MCPYQSLKNEKQQINHELHYLAISMTCFTQSIRASQILLDLIINTDQCKCDKDSCENQKMHYKTLDYDLYRLCGRNVRLYE